MIAESSEKGISYTVAARQDLCIGICKHCEQDSAGNRTVRPMVACEIDDDTVSLVVVLVGLEAEHRFLYKQRCTFVSCQISLDYRVHTSDVSSSEPVRPRIQDPTIKWLLSVHIVIVAMIVGKDPYQNIEAVGGAQIALNDLRSSMPFVMRPIREFHVEASGQYFDISQRSTSFVRV